jgi:hypothetical protein
MMPDSLIEWAIQLTRIIVPIIIIIGIVSNVLNVILLTRTTLVHHACSLYFLAMAITNLFYSSFLLILNLLADGYQIDITRHSSLLCKLISYLLNLCPNLSIYFLVLASIDRYCVSSMYSQRRYLSNVRLARRAIAILVLILTIFFLGTFIAFDLSHDDSHKCIIQSNYLFNRIFLIVVLILYVLIAPFSMIFFGLLTIYNTKQGRSIPVRLSRYRRTERQLSRMLLLQVGTHILLALPFCTIFFMLILPVQAQLSKNIAFAFMICKLPFYLTATTTFFLYVLSARVYRNELFRLNRQLISMARQICRASRDKTSTTTIRLNTVIYGSLIQQQIKDRSSP